MPEDSGPDGVPPHTYSEWLDWHVTKHGTRPEGGIGPDDGPGWRTLTAFAKAVGIGPRTLYNYLHGQKPEPPIRKKIAAVLFGSNPVFDPWRSRLETAPESRPAGAVPAAHHPAADPGLHTANPAPEHLAQEPLAAAEPADEGASEPRNAKPVPCAPIGTGVAGSAQPPARPGRTTFWKPDPSCEPASGEAALVRFHVLECAVTDASPDPSLIVHLSHDKWVTPLPATSDGFQATTATLRLKGLTLVPALKGVTPVPGSIFEDRPWHYGTAWTRAFHPIKHNGVLLDGETLARYHVTGEPASIRISVCCHFNDLVPKIENPPAKATMKELRVAERALQVLDPKQKQSLYVLAEGALLPPGRKK